MAMLRDCGVGRRARVLQVRGQEGAR